jgi:hypothetical protein
LGVKGRASRIGYRNTPMALRACRGLSMTDTAGGSRLDVLSPQWRHRERHRLVVDAARENVFQAVQEFTWRQVPICRGLMFVRGLGRFKLSLDEPVLQTMTSNGFYVLDRTDDEIVLGAVGPIGEGKSPLAENPLGDRFRDFDDSGYVRIGFNFRYVDGLLSTETRVWPLGRAARRYFRFYWMLIRPFSGLIRREWLSAIRRRAVTSR